MHTARILACSAGTVAALVAVAACGSSGSKTKTNSPSPSTSAGSSTSSSTSTSASATPSTSAATITKLRGSCDTLLPQPDVEDTLGVRLAGKTAYVIGVPEKNIGRLGYLNCRYGLGAGAKAVPKVEVGVSLYKTPAQAQRRLTGTISDYQDHGATRTPATVAGLDATLLVGTAPGYDVPTLVVASGQRTVAVSVTAATLPASSRGAAMAKLAALALERTGT